MKPKLTAFFFFLTLSCQGPWSYWPEGPDNYLGIWTYAYVIAGRPVEEVCFDKMHGLKEIRLPRFAFYEEASVKISGTFSERRYIPDRPITANGTNYEIFSGIDTSFFLEPKIRYKPNCFYGPWELIAEAGKSYELDVTMRWDSAGEMVTSNFNATTYIPQKFKIKRAYDLEGQLMQIDSNYYYDYDDGFYRFSYLPPPMDLQSTYYIPEYSSDVGGVLVSVDFNPYVSWGKSTIGETAEKFYEGGDSMFYAKFGYRYTAFFAENRAIAGMGKEIDSIPVMGMMMPALGEFSLLFYATTSDYVKFRNTFVNGSDDSRVQAVYNINGGAGIFAGILTDTLMFEAWPSSDVDLYANNRAKQIYCYTHELDPNLGWGSKTNRYQTRRECIDYWDDEISDGRHNWFNIPYEELRKKLTFKEFMTWCEFRDFPIYEYPPCGSALVRLYRMGAESAVLEREVKKWCEIYKNDAECLAIL